MTQNSITVTRAPGTWVVRAGGAVIGETENALEMVADGAAPVIFFPLADVEMAFLERGERTETSPETGRARWYAVIAKSGAIPNIAWSYEEPAEAVARLADHIAFRTGEKVTVEQI